MKKKNYKTRNYVISPHLTQNAVKLRSSVRMNEWTIEPKREKARKRKEHFLLFVAYGRWTCPCRCKTQKTTPHCRICLFTKKISFFCSLALNAVHMIHRQNKCVCVVSLRKQSILKLLWNCAVWPNGKGQNFATSLFVFYYSNNTITC